jgi:hypothetical protein
MQSRGTHRPERALEFVLNVNRNLQLALVIAFGMSLFAINADVALRPGKPIDGTLSGVCVGIAIALVVVVASVHTWMVYQNDRWMIPRSPRIWWYALPLATVVAATVPLSIYLILLFG